jgi:hypothetical protein
VWKVSFYYYVQKFIFVPSPANFEITMNSLPPELLNIILDYATEGGVNKLSRSANSTDLYAWYDSLRLVCKAWSRILPVRPSYLQLLPKIPNLEYALNVIPKYVSVTRDNILARHDLPWKSFIINDDATIEEILRYPNAAWDWEDLSAEIDMEDIAKNPHLPWRMDVLSTYGNSRQLARDYPNLNWKWELIERSKAEVAKMIANADPDDHWRIVTVENFPAELLGDAKTLIKLCNVGVWQNISKHIRLSPETLRHLCELGRSDFGLGLSQNPAITTAHVLAAPGIYWSFRDLYVRRDIDFGAITRDSHLVSELVESSCWEWTDRKQLQVLVEYPHLPWDWSSITFRAEIRFMLENLHLSWDHERIRSNPRIQISDLVLFPNFDWDWRHISIYSTEVKIAEIAANPELSWDYDGILYRDCLN